MFYRRKILLALLEACGGDLNNTDMEKLLFALCMEKKINYYDFFPYRFGCFSFLSYQDKRVLTMQGHLLNEDVFKLVRHKSYLTELKAEDRVFVKDFADRMNHLRGDELVRFIYLRYPYYASRSEIKTRILTHDEQARIDACNNIDSGTCLFTIGYEGLTIDSYINKLIENNIAVVIDVRRNPISMKYGFSKTKLCHYLQRVDITYAHIPELGIESSMRKNLNTKEDYYSLFEKYGLRLFKCEDKLDKIYEHLNTHKRVALTCFEAEAVSCHRHKITAHIHSLKHWNIPIVHIS